jgi:iron complex outermembrane receptor protein
VIFKRNVLALALASTGLCFVSGAYATGADQSAPTAPAPAAPAPQAATPTPQDTSTQSTQDDTSTTSGKKPPTQKQDLAKSLSSITVTGFSNSVEKSIDYQRYSDTIINVVTAADIGGLPDQSIADALTRLPGVAAERIAGQSSQINCRGLDGNFTLTTLNGREQPSTSGSNYTQFDQYPSELINQATIYKSSQASLIEGGAGCTVEMQTANPLESKKEQSLSVDVDGSYNNQAHDVAGANPLGYRFSAAWQGKFLDDTLGVGLGVAQMYQPHVSEQFVGEAFDGLQTINTAVPTQQAYPSEGVQLQQNGGEERRTGYLSTIVWKPIDHLQVSADAYFSKFNNQSYGYGYRSQLFDQGNANITNPIIGANGEVLGGTVTSANPGTQGEQFSNETTADNYSTITDIFSGGLNLKWDNGPWHIEGDLSSSHSSSNEINVDTTADPYNGLGTANPTLMSQSTTYALNGMHPGSVSFANPGIYTNLADMGLSRYGVYPYVYTEANKAFRANVKFDFLDNPVLSGLEGGVYINNHTYNADRSAYVYGSEWGSYEGSGYAEPPLALNSSDATVTCWKGSFAGYPCFLKLNGPAILAANGITNTTPVRTFQNGLNWTMIQSGTVNEKERDAFLMADIDTTLFGLPLTGNVGVRIAKTTQESDGIQEVDNNSGVPITDETGYTSLDYKPLDLGKTYTEYLPSLNLAYHLTDSDQMRVSVAKVMSRPPINYLLSGTGSYYYPANTYNLYGSTSPLLDPLLAMSYDVTYEHYFDDSSGLFTADAFFKHIDSFVQQTVYNNFDFASAGITVPINPATGVPFVNGEYQTAYNNTKGGYVRGMELSFQKTHFLPGIWSGLGVALNFAYTHSAVQQISALGGPPQEQAMAGLSRDVASASVFYDNGTFSAHLSGTHRSPWVSDTQIAVTNQFVYFDKETVFDLQTAYKLTKNLSVNFKVLNLTNEPSRTYFGNQEETGTLQYFGRTLYTGISLQL